MSALRTQARASDLPPEYLAWLEEARTARGIGPYRRRQDRPKPSRPVQVCALCGAPVRAPKLGVSMQCPSCQQASQRMDTRLRDSLLNAIRRGRTAHFLHIQFGVSKACLLRMMEAERSGTDPQAPERTDEAVPSAAPSAALP